MEKLESNLKLLSTPDREKSTVGRALVNLEAFLQHKGRGRNIEMAYSYGNVGAGVKVTAAIRVVELKVAISDIQKLFLGLEFLSEFKFGGKKLGMNILAARDTLDLPDNIKAMLVDLRRKFILRIVELINEASTRADQEKQFPIFIKSPYAAWPQGMKVPPIVTLFQNLGIPEKDWREASAAHQGMTLLQGMIAALEISI